MNQLVFRSIKEPIREGLSWDEKWRGDDKGLITCWETGRELGNKESDLAKKAERGELPVLSWKGGVERKILKGEKYGTLNYLAKWQGLRGEDLNIDLSKEIEMICSKTGMRIIYTPDQNKYANA
jgi:hypothetical protein